MKVLIIGGSNFIGRNVIEELLTIENLELTTFNRGITNPDLFPEIKKIRGDRNSKDIRLIFEENWDYVVDLSCYFPDSLAQIVDGINKSLKRYIFISTCSVYDNTLNKSLQRDESAPILECNDDESKDTSPASYGNRKARCERILVQSGLDFTIFRPALVYGKYDNTDRLYYWLYQIKKGNKLLVPGRGEQVFSITYVKDIVQAVLKSLSTSTGSRVYNVTTCPTISLARLIEETSDILNTKPRIVNSKVDILKKNKVRQWTDIPLWLDCNFYTYDNSNLLNDLGIAVTDFRQSLIETIQYYDSIGWKSPVFGMPDDQKDNLIENIR